MSMVVDLVVSEEGVGHPTEGVVAEVAEGVLVVGTVALDSEVAAMVVLVVEKVEGVEVAAVAAAAAAAAVVCT